ncbi:ABC-type transporter, integral membrane subunit [uncultured spirochete]|jgi:raffinose/stachyose/melibiose transport system permease protein|uniref:ABC-type transporter, integral membrane subunit n=1 Tax=uncultured spirochete TaxID=156406 RepID=A0A3P3XFM1_9SPIR|nr:carbohydrate ABC transporter permease [Rectinema subterraneum]SLM09749.1 ABC-type transporter, integral membrane subunit [uncultured spirochete]
MSEMIKETKLQKALAAVGRGAVYIVMSLFALMTLYPIFWLIMNSFKTTREFQVSQLAFPRAPTLQNYVEAWKMGDFGLLFPNSVLYTLGATAGIIFLSLMAGFAFAKLKSRATKLIYNSFVIGILLTTQTLMIPLFLEVNLLGLYNTRLAVLLVYIGAGLPIGIYLATEYIKAIPSAVVESARIDGAGFFTIFLKIIVPMSVPVATTLAMLNITGLWNEFALINILVSKTELKSLPLGIYKFSGSLSTDYGKQFAALTIGMVPMLVFYMIFRKQITKGVAAGAIKG